MAIQIRSVEAEDAEHFQKIASQEGIQESTLGMPLPSLKHWNEHLARNGKEGIYHFAALLDGSVAGILTIENPQHPRLRHKTTFGIFTDQTFSGKGIGSALMAFCITYSFDWLAARKIELEVFSDNETAIALYQKFGFKEEGLKRESALRKGKYVDVLLMGLRSPY